MLICTHILPDVQAVSDSVVILSRGVVRVADRLQTLSRPAEPAVQLRLLGDISGFMAAAQANGLQSEQTSDGRLVLRGPVDQLTAKAWQLAKETKVVIRSLAPARNSLEDIFLHAVQEERHGNQ